MRLTENEIFGGRAEDLEMSLFMGHTTSIDLGSSDPTRMFSLKAKGS